MIKKSNMNDKYVIEEQVGYLLRRTYFHHLTIFQQSLDETRPHFGSVRCTLCHQ